MACLSKALMRPRRARQDPPDVPLDVILLGIETDTVLAAMPAQLSTQLQTLIDKQGKTGEDLRIALEEEVPRLADRLLKDRAIAPNHRKIIRFVAMAEASNLVDVLLNAFLPLAARYRQVCR